MHNTYSKTRAHIIYAYAHKYKQAYIHGSYYIHTKTYKDNYLATCPKGLQDNHPPTNIYLEYIFFYRQNSHSLYIILYIIV